MLWLLPTILLSVSCHTPLEERALPPPGKVSVTVQHHDTERLCLVIHNGTQTVLSYDRLDNRGGKSLLERQILGPLWAGVRYATLGQWWHDLWQVRTLGIVASPPIPPQTTRSHLLRYRWQTFPAGRYRVCFRYRLGGETDGQETCSALFTQTDT